MKRRRSTSIAAAPAPSPTDSAITSILSGFDPKKPETLANVAVAAKENYKLFFLKMNRVQEDFIRCKNRHGRTPRTRLFEGANQSGKTTLGIAEDITHMMGFRPWLKKDDPDYRIRIKVPNNGLVGCEVAGQNLIQRIEPQFKEFIPAHCEPEWTRYSDGSVKS